MSVSLADIKKYVLGSASPAAGYAVAGVSGETGLKTAYVKHVDELGDITYFAFSLEALQVIANDPAVLASDNTNIHLYDPLNLVPPPQYLSKQTAGVLQTEVKLSATSTDVVQYLSFNVPPVDTQDVSGFTNTIAQSSTYQIKYFTNPANLSQITLFSKVNTGGGVVLENLGNGIFVVYNEVDFLRAAVGEKPNPDSSSINSTVPVVARNGIVKYIKSDGSVEYYQKAPIAIDINNAVSINNSAYFKQVNVDETSSPPGITNKNSPIIWREYGTLADAPYNAIDIEKFATDASFNVTDILYSGGTLSKDKVWVSGMSGETVRKFVKELDGSLKEDLSENGVYHYVYDNAAYKNAVLNAVPDEKIVDLRADLSGNNKISVGCGGSVGNVNRKKPSTTYAEQFQVHASKVLKRVVSDKMVYFNYGGELSEKTFATDVTYSDASGDNLYLMNGQDAELFLVNSAFKKSAHGLLRELKTVDTLGDTLASYRAYTQKGLKSAASLLANAATVTEQNQTSMVKDKVWTKYDDGLAALKDASDNYLTFYSINGTATDLSGAVSFPLTRKAFATTAAYKATNKLFQRIVQDDTNKDDIESAKLGDSAVNRASDASNSYAYADIGQATAARSADCKATVKLVTENEYHQDADPISYTKIADKYVLSLKPTDKPTTYYEYSDLSGAIGLTISAFATGESYLVDDVLSRRNITSGAEVDNYVKRFAGLVEDVSGVALGQEDRAAFLDNGKPGSVFYSYQDISGIMKADLSTDMPADMVVIQTAEKNEPTDADMSGNSYYKKMVGLAMNVKTKNCLAWNHEALKTAANIMEAGKSVTEKSPLADDISGWIKDASANTLKNVAAATYLTFYQLSDLSGAVSFPVSREAFAKQRKYALGDNLIQRIVTGSNGDSDKIDIESTKLGNNAVNIVSQADSYGYLDDTYVYGNVGLATAARSADCKGLVDLVTVADYHMDVEAEVATVQYTLESQYVLSLKPGDDKPTTYYEYSDLSGAIGLTISAFATGESYLVDDVLSRRNITSGAEVDNYVKRFAGLVEDVSGVANGIEAYKNGLARFADNGMPGSLFYSYVDISGIINAEFTNDLSSNMVVIQTAEKNEPSEDEMGNSAYYKRLVGLAQDISSGNCLAWNHQALKTAANIMAAGKSVTENPPLVDDIRNWVKDASANTLKNVAAATYLTFYQLSDLSGTVSFPVSREAFAEQAKYALGDKLIQRRVTDINAIADDIKSTKLGSNAVNLASDLSNSYAYVDIGLATAARSADCHATVKLVTAAEYHMDKAATPTEYTKMANKYVLSRNGTYNEYSDLSGALGLTIKAFATGSYAIGNILSKRHTTSGAEVDSYTKKFAGLVADASGVASGIEALDNDGAEIFADNGMPGILFYSYVDISGIMKAAFTADLSENMVVIKTAEENEPSDDEVGSSAYYKRLVGLAQNINTGNCLAWNHLALKKAASIMAEGETVTELSPLADDISGWIKDAVDNTLNNGAPAGSAVYMTFYSLLGSSDADLSGAVNFDLTREAFATGDYIKGDKLIQRMVTSATAKYDIVSTKLGDSAVNRASDASNSYAYTDTGLATAARSADCKATVKLVNAAEYHLDATTEPAVVNYTRQSQYVLKLESTYYEYSDLSGGLNIKTFANGASYQVDDILSRRNITSGAEVDNYIKRFAGLVEDVSGVASGREDSLGAFPDNGKPGSVFYSYVDISGIMKAAFTNDLSSNMVVIQTAEKNEPTPAEMTDSSYYKKVVGLAMNVKTKNCLAWDHLALKEAARIMEAGKSVTEQSPLADDISGWIKDASANTLVNVAAATYMTFYQLTDLSGTVSFPVSREAFAKESKYALAANLIQRIVTSATAKTDITSVKLGDNAVNNASDASNSYAYVDIGLATAARSADCKATVKLVTVADYHMDATVVSYTRQSQYVLSLKPSNSDPTTYYEYSDLSGGLNIKTFANGASYQVDDILSRRNITSGAEVDNYIKRFAGLVEDVSGVASGIETHKNGAARFTDNGMPGSLFYSYVDISGIINAAFTNDLSSNMVVIQTAEKNEPTETEMGNSAYYKRLVGLAQYADSGNCKAWNHLAMKEAARIMEAGKTVTEMSAPLDDAASVWTKDASDNTLKAASTYMTFYQRTDLSGTVAFPVSREAFAKQSKYALSDKLIQRRVTAADAKTDVESVKLGDNAVNLTGDLSNSYAYVDLGLATAARSASCKATVQLVTAADYHMDLGAAPTPYSLVKQNVLKITASNVTTYLEYNALASLNMKTIATDSTYTVGNVLKSMSSTGDVQDVYIKKFANLMADAKDVSGGVVESATSDPIYYAYADISGIMNASVVDISLNAVIVETVNNNEPDLADVRNNSYTRLAVGLAQKDSTTYHAYSVIGMYNFAILTGKTAGTTTVTEATTGFRVAHTGSTTWAWQSQNILMTGDAAPRTYLTYADGASALTERVFATSTTYEIDGSGAVLKSRTLSAVNVDSAAVTASEEQIRKISHGLTKSDKDTAFHAYSAIGRLNSAIDTVDLSANKIVQDRTISDASQVSFTYKQQYLLQKTGENKYFEYSGLAGDVSGGGATPVSSLTTLSLRTVATDDVKYPKDTELNQMQQDGGVKQNFVKKYTNIMLAGSQYYAYTTASLASIANDPNLAVGSNTPNGAPTEVWDISGANLPADADVATLYKKIEPWILRSGSSPYIYRSYVPASESAAGIPLPEFACKDVSANGVREFGSGDQLVDVSNNITYTRITRSVLKQSNDDVSGSGASAVPVFYVYSSVVYDISGHLDLKAAAIAPVGDIKLGSILKRQDGQVWIKKAINLVSSTNDLAGSTYYRTFKDVTGDAANGIVGAAAFAVGSYAIGSALRTVEDVSETAGSRFLKVLDGVLYHFETDYYDVYSNDSINGLLNVAQAVDLSENRTDKDLYNVRPKLERIEVGAIVVDVSNSAYYQRTERNVLFAIDVSGSVNADGTATFKASNPAHYYDYSVAGQFGTFTLEELATGSFAVGTKLTDMIGSDGEFEKKSASVILRAATKEYQSYDNSGTTWVAQNGVSGEYLMEKVFSPTDGKKNYKIARQNVLVGVDISGSASSAGNTYKVPAIANFYAYSLLSDASGIQVLSFANNVSPAVAGHYVAGDVLVERTASNRSVRTHTLVAEALLKTDDSTYQAYSQTALKTFAGLALAVDTTVTEKDGAAGAWADASGAQHQSLTYKYVSLNVLNIDDNSDCYVYRIDSDVSGLTLNSFATGSKLAGNRLFNRDTSTKVDGAAEAEGKIYNGPVYTKVLAAGVLSRQAKQGAAADAELRTYDLSGGVLGLRAAALAAVSDISDGTVLIPENDCPVSGRMVNLTGEGAKRRKRISKGLLRILDAHGSSAADTESYMAFQGAGEKMAYAALKQAAKNQTAAGAAVAAGREVAPEAKIYVTADGALTAYNIGTIHYTKDVSGSFPDTLRVGDVANLVACDKITFADYVNPLRQVMINFCEFDASGAVGDLTSSRAGLFAGKSIQNYGGGGSLPVAPYKVVRRGLMSTGADVSGDIPSTLEYYTFSDKGLVAAAVAAERNADGQFSYVKVNGEIDRFRRVAKGLLVSNSRLSPSDASDSTVPTAAIMYFSDYDSNKDDDKANMYFYLYSLATKRSIGVDLSGSSTTEDRETYAYDADGVLQKVSDISDGIIDSVAKGSITTLYSIVNLVGAGYGAEKYETIQYIQDASDVLVPNAIKVTPITDGGSIVTSENTYTGPSGDSFYVAYAANGTARSSTAALLALSGLANAPLEVVAANNYIYLGDKYRIDTASKYSKIDEGSLRAPDGQVLTYSLKGLCAFAHLYNSAASRSANIPISVSGEAADASGVYTQYLNYVYYWMEKGVVLSVATKNNSIITDLSGAVELTTKPANLMVAGKVQRYDVFYQDTKGVEEVAVKDFMKRAALADISGASGNADFKAGALQAGAKFVVHNDNNIPDTDDIEYYKVTSGLLAKYNGSGATDKAASYTYYAFNDYALAFGANDESVVNSEPILRMLVDNIKNASGNVNKWDWETAGLLVDATGADSGIAWRLYTNDDIDHGRQFFALRSDKGDYMDYYTYSYPDTTTKIYNYKNVLQGKTYYDASSNAAHSAVLLSDVFGLIDPSGSSSKYLTYGNAGLALIANSADISGSDLKNLTFNVLPINLDKEVQDDIASGTYLKLQDGAMYTGSNMTLYDENKFVEIMDREDIVEFATMDANNMWATPIRRKVLRPVPMERVFVTDADGNNQGSAKTFGRYEKVVDATTYIVEKVLERDLLLSGSNNWTTDVLTTLGESGALITSQQLVVSNKNGSEQTFQNRTWLRPIDIKDA